LVLLFSLIATQRNVRIAPPALVMLASLRDCFKIGYEDFDDAAEYTKFHRPPPV
jgi:hypothetical protein